jgi:hypothetical protein
VVVVGEGGGKKIWGREGRGKMKKKTTVGVFVSFFFVFFFFNKRWWVNY